MTFSILAFDPEHNIIGGAVASRWTGVGGCVQFFHPKVGLVHMQNQSHPGVAYEILEHMQNTDVTGSIEKALNNDPHRESRQCLAVSFTGDIYAVSGENCHGSVHQRIGVHCAAAGNTLMSENVVDAMIESFEQTADDLSFADRLLTALDAGQEAGGDVRGQEAAALSVYEYAYPAQEFHPIDLRVDFHDTPIKKLKRVYASFNSIERPILQ